MKDGHTRIHKPTLKKKSKKHEVASSLRGNETGEDVAGGVEESAWESELSGVRTHSLSPPPPSDLPALHYIMMFCSISAGRGGVMHAMRSAWLFLRRRELGE